MHWLKNIYNSVYQYLLKQTEDASHQITLFGLIMMINYPLFGVFWKLDSFHMTQEFVLRLIATALCALLAINKLWSTYLLRALPFFWYGTLLFCLPFFFSYLTLLNHGSTLWLMNCVSAVFFLLLVTSVLGALVLLLLGIGLAFLIFFSTHTFFEYTPTTVSVFGLTITFIAAVIIGALFARDRERIQAGRLLGMRMLAGSIAHDLRTPLASMYLQTELQEIILNKLNNSDVQKDLKISLSKIARGIEMSNQLISMQLNNITQEQFDTRAFVIHPIKRLLQATLEDYPLKDHQKSLIDVDFNYDFPIWIDEMAFKNLLWNVLKNSFDYIDDTGHGTISIWLEAGGEPDNFNYLHVRDTAKGLCTKTAVKLFDSFYTDRNEGTGLGLAYCKLLMQAAGGDIQCKGVLDEFAHFIIKFPKVD